MAAYLQFNTDAGGTILVEIEEETLSQQRGPQKAGLKETVSNQLAIAKTSFEEAVQKAIQDNARVFIQSVSGLPMLPYEAEITFALKMTSEVGNVAIGKLGGEANYTVKLLWRHESKEPSPNGI